MEASDPGATAEARVAQQDAPATAWDRLTPFLAAIGTSVGVIGFVTFMGGVIVWARVHATGVPPAPTLGVVPSQDLLVIGAETLVPMFLTAFVVVVALGGVYALIRGLTRLLRPQVARLLTDQEEKFLVGEATRLSAAGMFVFVFLALVVPLARAHLSPGQLVPAIVGIAVGAAIAAAVGGRTRRFMYLATTTFVLAGVFLGFVAYWSAGNTVKVRGAAIVRENRKAIAGIFVAEGAGRVYLALVSLKRDGKIDNATSRLVGIAKQDVTDIAIADRKTPKLALEQADRLAKELCELQLERPRPANGHVENCITAPAGEPQP